MQEQSVRLAIRKSLDPNVDRGSRVIEEMGLGLTGTRIDLAVVGADLTGWEIKTSRDNLARLPRQQLEYSKIFDRVWLAADGKHIAKAMDVVPEWWGIMQIAARGDECRLVPVRKASRNPAVSLRTLVELLWRDEVLSELEVLGKSGALRRAPRSELWDALANSVPHLVSRRQLMERVRIRLLIRENWRSD